MDHAKKLDFIHKMSKLALDHVQHFDAGGTVLTGPGGATGNGPASGTTTGGLAGGISSALGLQNTFQAQSANIQQGTNAAQLNDAYTGAQAGLTGVNNLAQTLTPQAQAAANQQAALAKQLQDQANGVGPNPAQTQLATATGANVANTAATMAGARGASSNVGLIARQAAEQGAGTQQQAAGQAATLGAQQQIAAQQELGNLSAQQISQTGQAVNNQSASQQAEQNILQQANTATNNNAVNMQSNINNVNAGVAAGNQGMAGKIIGGIAGAASSLFAKGGEVAHYDGGGQVAPPDPQKARDMSAGATKGGSLSDMWEGITNPKWAKGGEIGASPLTVQPSIGTGSAGSFVGNWLQNGGQSPASSAPQLAALPGPQDLSPLWETEEGEDKEEKPKPTLAGGPMDQGGQQGDGTMMAAKGGAVCKSCGGLMEHGGKVKAKKPDQKAVKKGNSYSNDRIPAMLSQGEIVLPRSVTQSSDPVSNAAKFVQATLAKKGLKKGLK